MSKSATSDIDSNGALALQEPRLRLLPIADIKPCGWFKNQLRIQADGLSGHLDEFWPSVMDSKWFGGSLPDTERAPYWLDGVIPLAWQLDDDALKAKVTKRVESILERQHDDGWIGPRGETESNLDRSRANDAWTSFLAAKMLAQYHDVTGEQRVLDALMAFLKCIDEMLAVNALFGWGYSRWGEGLVSIYYAYERTGETWLLELANTLKAQGNDWHQTFAEEDITVPTPRRGRWKWHKHVVNLAMAMKFYPLYSRLSGRDEDRDFIYTMMETLDRYHGQVTGVFSGDECVSGKNPIQGTELCAVADYIFSLGEAMTVLPDPALGDRLERIAYNAWPATFAPDMWSHQYDQQANQVLVSHNEDHMWSTNGPESNLYGLEPNFGCCTANMHMGWPKLLSHLWMRTGDDGLAAVAYAPSEASFTSAGVPVTVALDTDYPFRDALTFTVTAESPVSFPLMLRIPAWAEDATLTVDGEGTDAPAPGTFHRLEREWSGETVVKLVLPMQPASQRRYNGSIALERGPLVYSLKIGEEWRQINQDVPGREAPHADYEVHPTTEWNYGLVVDEEDLASSITFKERPMGECPFSPEGAPIEATVSGRQIPGYDVASGWAGELPYKGASSSWEKISSDEPLTELTLIPYGCTNLRITEFPLL
ncbi:MAG: glycoside hydrolase family 127 protein [Kiritimatiellia bacterium]|jgi:DUF1680 family protein|nr:glycoside hydrolase family 127 protein [Kiritimatiellia bacterium]